MYHEVVRKGEAYLVVNDSRDIHYLLTHFNTEIYKHIHKYKNA